MIRQTVIASLLLLLCTHISFSSSPGSENDWLSRESDPFIIHYVAADARYAAQLASLFQIAYADLVNRTQFKIEQPVHVFLAPSQQIFNDLTGNAVPHWGAGVADPVKSLIILKSPDMTDESERLGRLVRHELTHVLVGQKVRYPQLFPKWFNEGLAIYLSADEEFTAGRAISKALLSESIVPLSEIDEVLEFRQAKAALAYEEGYSFTFYLIEQYGFDAVIQLIREVNSSSSFEQTFQSVFGIDLFEAELDWYEYIQKKYRWSFLMDFDIYLWLFILLIFISGLVAVRFRNRRTITRWEEEERLARH